jgi:hypothetical protein
LARRASHRLLLLAATACGISYHEPAALPVGCPVGCVPVERHPAPQAFCYDVAPAGCAATSACVLLHPGCTRRAPTFTTAACFPARSRCGSDDDCPAGRRCQQVSIDPCFERSCEACGQATALCLPAGP